MFRRITAFLMVVVLVLMSGITVDAKSKTKSKSKAEAKVTERPVDPTQDRMFVDPEVGSYEYHWNKKLEEHCILVNVVLKHKSGKIALAKCVWPDNAGVWSEDKNGDWPGPSWISFEVVTDKNGLPEPGKKLGVYPASEWTAYEKGKAMDINY